LVKVLITDADYKHTLAAVRSLGQKGYYIIAGATSKHAQSFYSKYCNEKLIYPDPHNEDAFINFLLSYLNENNVNVLLPVGYTTNVVISKYKEKLLQYTRIPIADYSAMKIASNKKRTMKLAKKVGIPTPKEFTCAEQINNFPVVAKGIYESGHIHYINSKEELQKLNISDYILQEYIPGDGFGFYALFNHGNVKAVFMHKRLREYPITGGSSTAAASIYDADLLYLGLKLLKSLNWHGVAMVEFKKDIRNDKFTLMEINPKFWGSLDLSIVSGVDFSELAVKMALDEDFDTVLEYNKGIKFRWLFPDDTLHVLANPYSFREFLGDFIGKNTYGNVKLNDIKPNLIQFLQTGISIFLHLKNRNLKYPHGKPEFKDDF